MSEAWRLIVDGADDGARNMAIDEAILEAYDSDRVPRGPTLRLYGWKPATLSLGRSQREAGSHDLAVLLREGIGLVRRPTGGTAVLHEFERTYAVVGSLARAPLDGGVAGAYRVIASALKCGLQRLGIAATGADRRGASRNAAAFCFERTGEWEIEAKGRKLVGSAQLRRRGAVLQHGSIPIRLDVGRLEKILGRKVDEFRFTDLVRAAGREIDGEALDLAITEGFEEAFKMRLVPGSLGDSEAQRAEELRCWKYDSAAWTQEGVIGVRESRWGPALTR